MAAEEALNEEREAAQPIENEPERERSTIGFPYGDLEDAVATAKAVHEVGGSSCDWDQLAARLGQAAASGGFRQKALTAKTFGLITYSQGKVLLTALGAKICDSKQEKAARVDAFLKVELYKALYEKFKGGVIPQAKGLEAEMVTLGVAKKQSDKARQVFQRSATQADFFWSGQDRLVAPSTNGDATERHRSGDDPPRPVDPKKKSSDGGGDELHPLVEGLIKSLPPEGADWPIEKRAKWLRAASQNFDLIYPDTGDDFIEVKVHKGNTIQ